MFYTNPGFIYIILAILLCSIYYGIEISNGGLKRTGKSILISWVLSSFVILSIFLAIKKAKDKGNPKVTTKHITIMYGVLISSLISSSYIIYLADHN